VEYIEGGWPGSNPKDGEFFKLCKLNIGSSKTSTKLAAFGATRRKDSTCGEVSFIILSNNS
jgi:2-isopropylmalate synthase